MVMVLTQHDVFRWSRRLLLLAAIVFLLCALAADWVGPRGYEIWWTITGIARFLLVAISLLLPVALYSGLKTTLRTVAQETLRGNRANADGTDHAAARPG